MTGRGEDAGPIGDFRFAAWRGRWSGRVYSGRSGDGRCWRLRADFGRRSAGPKAAEATAQRTGAEIKASLWLGRSETSDVKSSNRLILGVPYANLRDANGA